MLEPTLPRRLDLRPARAEQPDGVLLSSLATRRPLPMLQPLFSIPASSPWSIGWWRERSPGSPHSGFGAFVRWAEREIARHTARLDVRFPEPESDGD